MPLDRTAHSILVPSAGATAGIGIIRSLGAAGYRVHAAAPASAALGLRSRYAAESVVHPPTASPQFAEWLPDYVNRWQIRMIMPGWGTGLFQQPTLSHLMKLIPVSNNPAVLDAGQSKRGFCRGARNAVALGHRHPCCFFIAARLARATSPSDLGHRRRLRRQGVVVGARHDRPFRIFTEIGNFGIDVCLPPAPCGRCAGGILIDQHRQARSEPYHTPVSPPNSPGNRQASRQSESTVNYMVH